MTFYGSSEEHDPVTWVRGHAIYAAHLVALVFVASMVIAGGLMAFHVGYLLDWLSFSSPAVLHGEVWRIFTYGLVNRPTHDRVLWFAIDLLMIVWFGREVEKFFGRTKFLVLYGGIYLLTPLLFTVLGPWMPTMLDGETGAFAMFIAFAALYPNVPIFFSLLAKWCAIILVGIYSLASLAEHDWVPLLSLWATTAFAYGYVRYEQGRISMPRLRWPRRQAKLRVLPDLPAKKPSAAPPADSSMAEVDALLDKIAQSGIRSLTAKERARLDAARETLKRRADR
ncbi:MAG TPA: rhomboid family intramembrane serine protease [Opitutaceae bacterium]|nr:rhomboid family intramembrane serine protease [Opitutaceae bacterium]